MEVNQSSLLLGHRYHRLLVHPHVVDSHAAEYRESLDEVLVVAGELEAVKLVHELEHPQHFVRLSRAVYHRHAQHRHVPERGAAVYGLVEALVLKDQR